MWRDFLKYEGWQCYHSILTSFLWSLLFCHHHLATGNRMTRLREALRTGSSWEQYSHCKVGFEFEANHVYVKAGAKAVMFKDADLEIHADTAHYKRLGFRSVEFVTQPADNLSTILGRVRRAEQVAQAISQEILGSRGWEDHPVKLRGIRGDLQFKGNGATFLVEDRQVAQVDVKGSRVLQWQVSPQVSRGVPLSAMPVFFARAFSRSLGQDRTFAVLNASLVSALEKQSSDPELRGATFYIATTACELTRWPASTSLDSEGPKAAYTRFPMPRTSFRAVFQSLSNRFDGSFLQHTFLLGACIGRAVCETGKTATPEEAIAFKADRLIRKQYAVGSAKGEIDCTLEQWVASMRFGRGLNSLDDYDMFSNIILRSSTTFKDWATTIKGTVGDSLQGIFDRVGILDQPIAQMINRKGIQGFQNVSLKLAKSSAEYLDNLLTLLRYADEDFLSPPLGLEGFHPRYSLGAMGLDGGCVVLEERAVDFDMGDLSALDESWQNFAEFVLDVDMERQAKGSPLKLFEVVSSDSPKRHSAKKQKKRR